MKDHTQKTGRRKRTGGFLFSLPPGLRSILGLLLLLSRCGGYPPEILEVRSQLMLFQDRERGKVYEYLSVALWAEDQDGFEDLESLTVIHDQEELYWLIPAERWSRRQIRQDNWILAEALLGPPTAAGREKNTEGNLPRGLPRGSYRLVLRDYAGRKAEISFPLEVPPEDSAGTDWVFPALAPGQGELELLSPEGEAILLVVSPSGSLLGAFTLKKGSNSRDSILSNSQVRTQAKYLYLYQPPGAKKRALISGPYEAGDYLFPGEL